MNLAKKFHHEVFLGSGGTNFMGMPHRTAGRLLEEAVELCLATGETGDNILLRVADALVNEARKKRDRTGELVFFQDVWLDRDKDEILTEIADVQLLLDYLKFQEEVTTEDVDRRMMEKVEKLAELAKSGETVVIAGCVYRKVR